jgi:hypothetical protein
LLAFAIALSHASTYWKSTILHFLNFLIYLLSLTCFAFFFRGLTALASEEVGLPEKRPLALLAWNLFGYSVFVYASIELVRLDTDTPDMLVAAACFLATGILVCIRNGGAYFLVKQLLCVWELETGRVAYCLSFCLLPPFRQSVAADALERKRTFHFGETGRLNYAWYVRGTGTRLHPVRPVSNPGWNWLAVV